MTARPVGPGIAKQNPDENEFPITSHFREPTLTPGTVAIADTDVATAVQFIRQNACEGIRAVSLAFTRGLPLFGSDYDG